MPLVNALGQKVEPHPDDFCHRCWGAGSVLEDGASRLRTLCTACDGTGWEGLRWVREELPALNPADAEMDRLIAAGLAHTLPFVGTA